MNKLDKGNMTIGNIPMILIKKTAPMIISIFSMMLFNIADTFFVGQLGKNQLAALSLTFPVVMTVQSLALGIGTAVTVIISRLYGEGNHNKLKAMITDSLFLAFFIVVIVAGIGINTIEPLFRLIGATDIILPMVKEYMNIWYIGVIFVVIPMTSNSAFRGLGDTKTPSIIMMIAVVVNVILDPLFIFGIGPFPEMGISGAAIATVFARMTTFSTSLFILIFKKKIMKIRNRKIFEILINWKQILFIGIPGAASRIIIPIGIGFITRIISIYGTSAIAAYGIGSRIETFVQGIIMALSVVMIPFVGQNVGAKKFKRVNTGINISITFSIIWCTLLYIFILFYSKNIAFIFNKDKEVINYTSIFLITVGISFGFRGVLFIITSILNSLKKPIQASILSISGIFIFCIPLAILGSKIFNINGVFYGISIGYFLSGIIALLYIKILLKLILKENFQNIKIKDHVLN